MVSQIGGTILTDNGGVGGRYRFRYNAKVPWPLYGGPGGPHDGSQGNSNPVGNAETDLIRILIPQASRTLRSGMVMKASPVEHDHNIISWLEQRHYYKQMPDGGYEAINAGSVINRYLRGAPCYTRTPGGDYVIGLGVDQYQAQFQNLSLPLRQDAINAIDEVCRLRYRGQVDYDVGGGKYTAATFNKGKWDSHQNMLAAMRNTRAHMEATAQRAPNLHRSRRNADEAADERARMAHDAICNGTIQGCSIHAAAAAAGAGAGVGGSRRKRKYRTKRKRRVKSKKRTQKSKKRRTRK